jgi:hypothetical protein
LYFSAPSSVSELFCFVASKFILLELPSPVTERPAVFSYPFNVSELEVSATRFDDEVCFVSVVLLSFVPEFTYEYEDIYSVLNTEEKQITNYYGLKNIVVTTEYKFVDDVYSRITTEETQEGNYGTSNNPIIITNRINKLDETTSVSDWELYFTKENAEKFFRIVQDIDFGIMQNNPTTCNLEFSGNIQGNCMNLDNIMLYTTVSADSIGLFKEIVSSNDYTKNYAIRNLNLTPTTVWASKINAVGLLAGVVENYNLYNIKVNASLSNNVIVGGNAVGGIAGIVRGNFDLQRLSSSVGANSTRATSTYKYSVYMSHNNNKDVSYNLANVYYAGCVIGILDGYNNNPFDINATERSLSKTYFEVKDYFSDYVCYNEDGLFDKIRSIKNDYEQMCPSDNLVRTFHKFVDGNSCERYYNEIVEK